jgi:hypothetical protein
MIRLRAMAFRRDMVPSLAGVVCLSALVTAQSREPRALPCVYWRQGIDTRATLEAAGIKSICVAAEQADAWRAAGLTVSPVTAAELESRIALAIPGITPKPGIASPTRSPWVVANGWRFLRDPAGKYGYAVPAGSGKGALIAAEAFAYNADAIIAIDSADAAATGAMLAFVETIPALDLPPIADLAVVDDGSAVTGEVINLLVRRNLLFELTRAPSSRYAINVKVGDPAYPASEAADPSSFALKIRRQITDEKRSLRVYGSEVVICRLSGDKSRARLQVINYGGREIEGLRIRVRGRYSGGEAYVAGAGRTALADQVASEGTTELSIPRLGVYAVVDLKQ